MSDKDGFTLTNYEQIIDFTQDSIRFGFYGKGFDLTLNAGMNAEIVDYILDAIKDRKKVQIIVTEGEE